MGSDSVVLPWLLLTVFLHWCLGVCGYRTKCQFLSRSLFNGFFAPLFLFPLWSSGLCGLDFWHFVRQQGVSVHTEGWTSGGYFAFGPPVVLCLSWGVGHSDEDGRLGIMSWRHWEGGGGPQVGYLFRVLGTSEVSGQQGVSTWVHLSVPLTGVVCNWAVYICLRWGWGTAAGAGWGAKE